MCRVELCFMASQSSRLFDNVKYTAKMAVNVKKFTIYSKTKIMFLMKSDVIVKINLKI